MDKNSKYIFYSLSHLAIIQQRGIFPFVKGRLELLSLKKAGGKGLIFFVLSLLVIALIIYTIWDNNRIKVVEQEIVIHNLPKAFEGFRILQVTDLHEKEFGTNQFRLVNLINSISYDAIVFTGDMVDAAPIANYTPFYDLIDGIHNKENALYIPGNADPENYTVVEGTVKKSDFVMGIEARGVKLLESIETIRLGEARLDFVDFELSIMDGVVSKIPGIVHPSYLSDKGYLAYQKELLKELDNELGESSDEQVLIALSHYPAIEARIEQIHNRPYLKFRDYDLIIAGHYHGGQIRLPFLGALFVPEPWNENNGLFPPRDRVKGLWKHNGTQQYVSAGLGSSDAISFLNFRFLNPPEINVLTLTSGR